LLACWALANCRAASGRSPASWWRGRPLNEAMIVRKRTSTLFHGRRPGRCPIGDMTRTPPHVPEPDGHAPDAQAMMCGQPVAADVPVKLAPALVPNKTSRVVDLPARLGHDWGRRRARRGRGRCKYDGRRVRSSACMENPMDPVSGAVIGWLVGQVGTATTAGVDRIVRGDKQLRALRQVVRDAVEATVGEVTGRPGISVLREALLLESADTIATESADVFDLEAALARQLDAKLSALAEQGYHYDANSLVRTLARYVRPAYRQMRSGMVR
jgi:hypothetical protein